MKVKIVIILPPPPSFFPPPPSPNPLLDNRGLWAAVPKAHALFMFRAELLPTEHWLFNLQTKQVHLRLRH